MNIRLRKSTTIFASRLFMPLVFVFFASTAVTADTIDDLNLDVEKSKTILSSMHKKAKKALVNSAQDQTFKDYFGAHDDDHKHELKKKIDSISLNVQEKFDVAEMCLIDPNGSEISRIVGSKIAYDLSNEEASADFFAPAFAQRARTAYQSPVYISPDVDKWVVAYVTPVIAQNEKKAILHYEIGLDVFQSALTKVSNQSNSLKLAVSSEGWVIWQQGKDINTVKTSDTEEHSAYFEKFEFGGKNIDEIVTAIDYGSRIFDENAMPYLAAYRKVGDWYVLALDKTDPISLSESVD